jgi:uncharacterized protein (DUF362 family)
MNPVEIGVPASPDDRMIAVAHDPDRPEYPETPPFEPSEPYPEIAALGCPTSSSRNVPYALVRESLAALGLDPQQFGGPDWNPLGFLVQPGDSVFVKLNLVVHEHELGMAGLAGTINHGSVLRAVLDYLLIALKGEGEIIVGDSPIKETDFDRALEVSGCAAVIQALDARTPVRIRATDIRDFTTRRDLQHVMRDHVQLPGDPRGYVEFDLGAESFFHDSGVDPRLLRSTAEYYTNKCSEGHSRGRHRYSVARSLIEADALISLSKLKVHRKAGTTLSQKNMVGTTNLKEWLPHHRLGSRRTGGDQYEDDAPLAFRIREHAMDYLVRSRLGQLGRSWLFPGVRMLERLPSIAGRDHRWEEGDWAGNDTIWRTLLDLNNCVLYGTPSGDIGPSRKRYLSLVDGVVGGEAEGPLHPRPVPAGLVVAGSHPWSVDWIATREMGLRPEAVPYLNRCRDSRYRLAPDFGPDELKVVRFGPPPTVAFDPPTGWEDLRRSDTEP